MNRSAAILALALLAAFGASPRAQAKVCVREKTASGVFSSSHAVHARTSAPRAAESQWVGGGAATNFAPDRSIGSNDVGQIATLKFIGEEYSTSTGGKGAWDAIQDFNASSLGGGLDFGFRDAKTNLPTLGIPESWRTGNGLQKAITQFDYLYHDLGPANINLKSAALMSGVTSPTGINALGKYLTTDVGTVDYSVKFITSAQNDLAPLIQNMNPQIQSQIIVDYVRKGSATFWDIVKENRGINDAQLNQWKQSPDLYQPLQPTDNYIQAQYNQIHKTLNGAKTSN